MEIYKTKIKENFENPIGQEFYTYYLGESKRGTRFNTDTGIFKVKIIKESPNTVFTEYKYEVIEILGKPKGLKYNLESYVNNFHACSANKFFTTEEEAIKSYDDRIKEMIKNPRCNADELKLLHNKLITKISDAESAKIWYNSLEPIHKDYFKILKSK